jgi:putative sigma-54 modulation protein
VKTTLTARNMELTDRLRAHIERKLQRLDRISHPDAEASVELIANASHANDSAHMVEVTLLSNGTMVRSTSTGATPLAAFDTVLDKLERQVVRSKERPRSNRLRSAEETNEVLAREATATVGEDEIEATGPSVVKLKRFDMVPMFEEDAIARLEELGHAFFVFLNAETEQIAVLYRRKDGNYGMIEPVLPRARKGPERKR